MAEKGIQIEDRPQVMNNFSGEDCETRRNDQLLMVGNRLKEKVSILVGKFGVCAGLKELSTWLYRVTVNTVLMKLRQRNQLIRPSAAIGPGRLVLPFNKWHIEP
jgi:hypothetical protein